MKRYLSERRQVRADSVPCIDIRRTSQIRKQIGLFNKRTSERRAHYKLIAKYGHIIAHYPAHPHVVI